LENGEDDKINESEEFPKENREGLLKILAKAIGFDITTITLPVTLNEPVSFLMRLCEGIQYSELLDKAALCEDSIQRLMYVALFAISAYTCAERTGKPFNPLLGETYEYVDKERNNLRFMAEQVSHHPPMGACHAETDTWKFWQSQVLKTKFTGNALDCQAVGSNNVYMKETNEHFKWVGVRTVVHNVIVGKMWIDHFGETEVVNKSTGEKAKLRFKQCGWFNNGWHEVDGDICDAQGNICITIFGKWNESIFGRLHTDLDSSASSESKTPSSPATPVTPSSPAPSSPADSSKPISKKERKKEKQMDKKKKKEQKKELKQAEKKRRQQIKEFKKQIKEQLTSNDPMWVHILKPLETSKLPPCKYMVDWTTQTLQLVEFNDFLTSILPPTDSRTRPDRYALEKMDIKKAAAEKHTLEEKQREDKKKERK